MYIFRCHAHNKYCYFVITSIQVFKSFWCTISQKILIISNSQNQKRIKLYCYFRYLPYIIFQIFFHILIYSVAIWPHSLGPCIPCTCLCVWNISEQCDTQVPPDQLWSEYSSLGQWWRCFCTHSVACACTWELWAQTLWFSPCHQESKSFWNNNL